MHLNHVYESLKSLALSGWTSRVLLLLGFPLAFSRGPKTSKHLRLHLDVELLNTVSALVINHGSRPEPKQTPHTHLAD